VNTVDKVIEVCRPYLGPAAEQFIKRQCAVYLGTNPDKVVASQLAALAKGVETSAVRVMDEGKAKELATKIAGL